MINFLKRWMLVIGIVAGACLYIIYRLIPALHPAGPVLLGVCKTIQPILLFAMLLLTFSKIEPRDLRPHRWQWWLLLIQALGFLIPALALVLFPNLPCRLILETVMLCFIMPTATSGSVVTERLGGEAAGVLTYTILINLLCAVIVPIMVPLIHPSTGLDFLSAFSRILAKVFPLLILPCLCAWLIRYMCPPLHRRMVSKSHLSFYIWSFALTLAILMSARALYHSGSRAMVIFEIAASTLLCCAVQFWLGKRVGAAFDRGEQDVREITAGQSLGQKNTVFGIWMGYTFLTPVIALCGGFYSIFHNFYNTWQLARRKK